MVLSLSRKKRDNIKGMLKKGSRKALTLIEAMLVLTVLAIVLSIVFIQLKKAKVMLDTQKAMSNIQSILNYIENVKAQSGGVLPAQDTLTPMNNIPVFAYLSKTIPEIGHDQRYQYQCSQSGDTGTLVIHIPLKDDTLCQSVRSALQTKYATFQTDELKYTFTCTGTKKNILEIKEEGTAIVCQEAE